MLSIHDAHLNLALWTCAMFAITQQLDGRTQCMSLSAAIDKRTICSAKCGTQGLLATRREDISREWWHGKKNHSLVGRC